MADSSDTRLSDGYQGKVHMTSNATLLKIIIALVIIGITTCHYATPTSYQPLHELYKVLYFLPIILAAFGFGLRGGLSTALVITVLYLPHIMFQWGGSFVTNISRFFMILLYITLGSLTGYLWEQEKKQRRYYQQASEQLEESLSELKRTSEEMAQLENQLRAAERLSVLGELTASLAHEVRNPLGSIRGVAEILRDESANETHQKFVNILLKETQRLESVVANYLELSRQKELEKAPVRLDRTIESTLALLGPEIRKKNLQVRTVVEPRNLMLSCHEGQLRQLLVNVLLNAIQASPAKGTIEIHASADESRIRIEIADQGPGLSEEAKRRIFDPFFSEKPDGTGLGMAISKRIVQSHDGRIQAQNLEPKGARITIEFPKKIQNE